MRRHWLGRTLALAALVFASTTIAQVPSRPPLDAPELAALGSYSVGTQVATIAARPGRSLAVRLWYPAQSGGTVQPYRLAFKRVGAPPLIIDTAALAASGAAPLAGRRFPLVIVSHGYRGFATSMSYLGENLASKGYVVAAIDHADQPFANAAEFARSFGEVVVNRSHDQRAVITTLIASARAGKSPLDRAIDPAAGVGLIGYSMGGFGALATTGAAYDPAGPTIRALPPVYAAAALDPSPSVAGQIKALVLIAPWGGQPDSRAWTLAALAKVTAPTLFIAGNQDDIVDYRRGVRFLFEGLVGADRRLLVYREARHNVGGNAHGPATSFAAIEAMAEPVWRGDRINAINLHFVTALLDARLKGEASRLAYLDVPTVISSDAVWQAPFGSLADGAFAGDGEKTHWRGFQRRWAVGLELHHLSPRVPGAP